MKTKLLFSALCAAMLMTVVSSSHAETVLKRKRIGNNSEGVTYVTTGRWANHAVAIDGNDVIAIDLGNQNDLNNNALKGKDGDTLAGPGWRKIFDVAPLGMDAVAPRGIAFIPGTNQFVFGSFETTNLLRTDQFGHPLPPIVPNGLANPDDFQNYEGLTWVPPDAPEHPNTIAAIMIRPSDFLGHIIYVRLDGTVEAEVIPQSGTPLED